jgi:hypothetical protein
MTDARLILASWMQRFDPVQAETNPQPDGDTVRLTYNDCALWQSFGNV